MLLLITKRLALKLSCLLCRVDCFEFFGENCFFAGGSNAKIIEVLDKGSVTHQCVTHFSNAEADLIWGFRDKRSKYSSKRQKVKNEILYRNVYFFEN